MQSSILTGKYLRVLIMILVIAGNNLHAKGQQPVKLINLDQLMEVIEKDPQSRYVVNFWATWCAPCIKELPHFARLQKEYKDKQIKVLLVSLDDPDDLNTRVVPFVERRKPDLPVFLLNEADPNVWMPRVSSKWTGAIPATLLIQGGRKVFFEQEFEYNDLKRVVDSFIAKNNQISDK